ncbi:hypothetical protein BH18ACT4_BH18ACT4_03580 [soil metagenome]
MHLAPTVGSVHHRHEFASPVDGAGTTRRPERRARARRWRLVDADWTLVDQAVTNLVANAVRHAPEGSRIWVSARRADDHWVEVAVRDQGPGLPRELRDEVFEPFRSGPGSTSSGVGRGRALDDVPGLAHPLVRVLANDEAP